MVDLFTLEDRATLLINFIRTHSPDEPVFRDGVRTTVHEVVLDQLRAASRPLVAAVTAHLTTCGIGDVASQHAMRESLEAMGEAPLDCYPAPPSRSTRLMKGH